MNQLPGSKFAIIILGVAGLVGCSQPPAPYVPKPACPPKIVYCNDNTGHINGAKPWIQGGTCCCTPTPELMEQLHKDSFCTGMAAEDLCKEYEKAGISLAGKGHHWCNGLCPASPHVVLGGKCMCPPTPGTENYEKIITGQGAPPRSPKAGN